MRAPSRPEFDSGQVCRHRSGPPIPATFIPIRGHEVNCPPGRTRSAFNPRVLSLRGRPVTAFQVQISWGGAACPAEPQARAVRGSSGTPGRHRARHPAAYIPHWSSVRLRCACSDVVHRTAAFLLTDVLVCIESASSMHIRLMARSLPLYIRRATQVHFRRFPAKADHRFLPSQGNARFAPTVHDGSRRGTARGWSIGGNAKRVRVRLAIGSASGLR